jgi:hypothetical protein
MRSTSPHAANTQLALELVIVAAVFAAFAIGDGLASALVSAGIVLAFVLVVHLGRRRAQSLEVMGGLGDERVQHLSTRVAALTGWIMACVLPGWWLVTVALGDNNRTLNIVCAIYGVTFMAAAVLVSRRS